MFRCSILLALAFAGCVNPDDDALRSLTRSGHDARYYNPATGRYEWPEDETPRGPRKSEVVGAALREQEEPAEEDARAYNPQTRQFDSAR